MPIRHRANLSRPNEPHKCPKDLHARLRDPKCRKEMKDIPDPQPTPQPTPQPPAPPPSPVPPTPIIPIKPIPPTPTPSSGGGGGLTPAEIAAITGGSLLGAAAIGIGAAKAISQMKGAAGYDPVAGSEAEAAQAELGGEAVQAEIVPFEETADVGAGTEMTTFGSSAEQAAGTTAERQSVLSGARAAAATTPATEGTAETVTAGATEDELLASLGKGAGGEGWGGSAGQAGMTLAKAKEASPTYVNPEEDTTITGEDPTPAVQTATATDSGELAADTSAVSAAAPVETSAIDSAALATGADTAALETSAAAAGAGFAGDVAADSAALALGPEAIPAVFATVAVTAIASFAPDIISAITGGSSDYYYGLKHAERYGDNWDSVSDSLLTSAAAITDPTQQTDALNYISSLDKANSDGLEIVKWQDEATDQLNITAQKGVKSLALAVAKYQNDPDAFKGQDPRVLAIEGLNPIMAYGANGAVLNPSTGKYQPVASYADVKDIDQTLASTSASLLKETQDNTADDRGITATKMDTIVANTYTDDDLLPTSTQNIYLSNQGNEATNIDTSVLSTQAGIMNTVGTSAAALAYIGTLTTPAVTATTPATTTPTTGGTTAQTPSTTSSTTSATTAAAPTTGGTTAQKPATTTTSSTTTSSTSQGTALTTESAVAQKTQNK